MDGRTEGRTDDAKTISLRLRRGIINIQTPSAKSVLFNLTFLFFFIFCAILKATKTMTN